MPMVAGEPGSHQNTVSRSGRKTTIGDFAPPGDLFPSGGAPVPAPAPAPDRVLALDALYLLRGLRDPHRRPAPWGDVAFARQVDLIRCHLAPLRNRRSLTASFNREAFQTMDLDRSRSYQLGPIHAAYAIRWLELGRGGRLPAWTSLVATERA